jgi:hypothetical protein
VLAHGLGVFLLLFPFALLLWLLPAIGFLVWNWSKQRRLSLPSVGMLVASIGLLLVLFAPYGLWQRLADSLSPGPARIDAEK